VTSELGRTSTFTLWLPLDRAEQRPGHPAGPELAEVER
jgi:hypothetical protein